MNNNNSASVIKMTPRKSDPNDGSKFITDEEIDQIHKEISMFHLSQRLKRVEEVCRGNMRKQLGYHYEKLTQEIKLTRGEPGREEFLKQVQKAMKNYIDDTLSDGADQEAFYILCYFLEINDEVGRIIGADGGEIRALTGSDVQTIYVSDRFHHLKSEHDQKSAIGMILQKYL